MTSYTTSATPTFFRRLLRQVVSFGARSPFVPRLLADPAKFRSSTFAFIRGFFSAGGWLSFLQFLVRGTQCCKVVSIIIHSPRRISPNSFAGVSRRFRPSSVDLSSRPSPSLAFSNGDISTLLFLKRYTSFS